MAAIVDADEHVPLQKPVGKDNHVTYSSTYKLASFHSRTSRWSCTSQGTASAEQTRAGLA